MGNELIIVNLIGTIEDVELTEVIGVFENLDEFLNSYETIMKDDGFKIIEKKIGNSETGNTIEMSYDCDGEIMKDCFTYKQFNLNKILL